MFKYFIISHFKKSAYVFISTVFHLGQQFLTVLEYGGRNQKKMKVTLGHQILPRPA